MLIIFLGRIRNRLIRPHVYMKHKSVWNSNLTVLWWILKTAYIAFVVYYCLDIFEHSSFNLRRLSLLGFVAGKYHNQPGNGADSLCLPENPSWANFTDGNDYLRGKIYGSEIHIEEPSKIFQGAAHNQDLPCAVCESRKPAIIMLPARTTCFPGWAEEYTGSIMANYHSHAGPYNHICVDFQPDFVPNGGAASGQHVLYLIEAQGGALPCPPYVQGRELACIVCSKSNWIWKKNVQRTCVQISLTTTSIVYLLITKCYINCS